MIGRARRRESASACAGNFIDAMCPHNFLDKIDIPLQVAPVTRDFPYRAVAQAALARRRFTLARFA